MDTNAPLLLSFIKRRQNFGKNLRLKKLPDMKNNVFKTWFLFSGILFSLSFLSASEPDGYYRDAYGKGGYTLKTALHNIIKGHTVVSYSGLFNAYQKTDEKDGRIWDMYSNCNFSFSNRCGNYKNECDCYNREHSFPKSWFDDATPMYSDLFHLYPTDGKVNGMRSNYPFGEVGSPTYTSANGSKLGNNTTSGYSGKVFEPIDEYKGDFARSYFYMATRYEDKIASWRSCPICGGDNKASFKQWTVDLLLKWHRQDPVSQKEKDRNDAVYNYQHNRNPFIDHPELVEKIWGNDNTVFDPSDPNLPPVNPDDPDDPDNPDNPDDPDNPVATTTYEIWYEYHDAEGRLVEGSDNMLTIRVPQSKNMKAESTVLMDEHFSKMGGTEESSSAFPATVDLTDGHVKEFTGAAYQGVHSVRLASSSKPGSIVFDEIDASGDFSVTVSGKGWSASEQDFTLECSNCTPSSRQVSFTKSKTDLSSGVFETLDPVTFNANGKVTLTLSTVAKKRVYIDRVQVVGGHGGGENPDDPDNPGNPDLTAAHSLKVLYPVAGDTVRKASITARVAVVDTDGAEIARYTLKKVELPDTGNYTFWTNFWKDEEELSEQSVAFVYALPKPGDSVVSEPVEAPVFDPDGGEVAKGAEVRISCNTEGAAIYYTTDGSEPTGSDEEYIQPIVINQSVTIKAIAIKEDEKSDVAQASFTVKGEDPVDVEMFTGAEFRMYPNPTSGSFVLEMTSDDNLIEIFSVKGNLVSRHRHVGEHFETKLSRTGVYFVRVTNIYGGSVRRLVVR